MKVSAAAYARPQDQRLLVVGIDIGRPKSKKPGEAEAGDCCRMNYELLRPGKHESGLDGSYRFPWTVASSALARRPYLKAEMERAFAWGMQQARQIISS